jgi:hypothetical protein
MVRRHSVVSAFLAALATFGALVALVVTLPAQRAAAFVESATVLVTNQYGGAGCENEQLLLANPFTGALVEDLNTPNTAFGVFNEAKPFDANNKIVALWGGSSTTGQTAGLGVYDRNQHAWTTSWALPSDFEKGGNGSHSVTVLPDGYFAVAHAGTIASAGSGYVVVFSPTGSKVQQVALTSAHGVEWDATRSYLFATGTSYVKKYAYSTSAHTITESASWQLPTTGGHDLRRRRTDNDFFVTTNSAAYIFRPESGTPFTVLNKSDGTPVGSGVKTVDQRFDGVIEYGYYQQDQFYFTDRTPVSATFCTSPYKAGRWIWAEGEKLYPEDVAVSPPPPSAPVDPFLWSKRLVKPTTTSTVGGAYWVGAAVSGGKETVKTNLATRVANGETPYVYFYQFGDNGNPPMSDVHNANASQFAEWELFGQRIAEGIGTGTAYVVIEPEWDANITGACKPAYLTSLTRIINKFKTIAPNARLINGPGLWNQNDAAFSCFASVAALFHYQGFLEHVVSSNPACIQRTNGTTYDSGATLTEALKIVGRIRAKAARVKKLFGGGNVFLTDLAVTRCGWGDDGQKQIFKALVDALPALYNDIGLRGVPIRDGGPAPAERYLGVENEGQFNFAGKSGETEVNRGTTVIQAHLQSISSAPATPTFSSAATAPANVAPGNSAPIAVNVTNTGGSLTDGVVDVVVKNAGGTQVGIQSFTAQSFSNGASRDYQYAWTASTTPGQYTVNVGVYNASRSTQYDYRTNAATITVGTSDPAFTSSATASPSSLAPGATTTVTGTVTNTGGTLTGGTVEMGIYSPTGTQVAQQLFTGQTIVNGASPTYQMTWAPATADMAGTYSVRIGVTDADGTTTYHGNGAAGSVEVTPATFTTTATPSPTTVKPGGTTTITTVVNAVGGSLSNGIVDLEIYDESGVRVTQNYWTGQSIASGGNATYSYTWTAPTATGSYTVKVGVYTASWASTLHWNARAATIGVTAPAFDTAASASPAAVTPGGTTTVAVAVTTTGGTLTNGIVDLEIFNAGGTRVLQQYWSGQTLTSGTTANFSYAWTAPSTAGTYTVKVGVYGAAWTPQYAWNAAADTIRVAQPSFTSTGSVSTSTVTSGATTTITATFTNTGGAVVNGIADIEVYNPSGTRVNQVFWTAQSIADGEIKTYTYTWTAPSTTGTYSVRLGVFGAGWTPTHHWNGAAATIAVGSGGGGTFQPSFQVGDGANTWWIEVYTSNDVTGMDVLGRDGVFYMSLTKKSWGAWAGTPPSQLLSGQNVKFVARRSSDGATAAGSTFAWLTGAPVTQAGWACTFTVGSGSSTSWLEIYTSSGAVTVDAKVGTGGWVSLTHQGSGAWAKAMTVSAGSRVLIRATRSDGANAYSPFYYWLQ